MEQYCLNHKTTVYTFIKNKKTLVIKASIQSLTIEGNENIIIFEAEVLNTIINGNKNQINARHPNSYLENVIFNGNHNKISATNTDFIKINNGNNNTVNNIPLQSFQFGNGNMNISNSNNGNINIQLNNQNIGQFTNIADLINMVTGNGNIEAYDEDSNNDSSDEYEYDNSNENADDDNNEADSDEEKNDNDCNSTLDKRQEIILNLNEFQYKHANKYLTRTDDKCAICFEKYIGPDIVKQFACGEHIYHKKCLFTWLKKSDICPLCKYNLNKGILKENIENSKTKGNSITKSNINK